MKILIIGSGGREHALAWKCAHDISVEHIFVCPGNAGTHLEDKISNIEINASDFGAIENFCISKEISLVIIGPEQPLVDGLTNYLQSKGIDTFGPSKEAAQLEGSKTFSKDFFVIPGFLSCTLLKRHSLVRRTDPLPLTSIAPPSNTNCFDLLLILTTGSIFFTLVNFDNLLLILLSFL